MEKKTRILVRNGLFVSQPLGFSEILGRILDFPPTPEGAQRDLVWILRNRVSPANTQFP